MLLKIDIAKCNHVQWPIFLFFKNLYGTKILFSKIGQVIVVRASTMEHDKAHGKLFHNF